MLPNEVMTMAGEVILDGALAVLLDKAGGEVSYTQAEYLAIKARRGPYQIVGTVDKSDPAEPRIVVQIRPAPGKSTDPVS
jgi:hypothetical protein